MKRKTQIENRYVAFCDILGFSKSVINDFDVTLELYKELTKKLSDLEDFDDVNISIYSDSILVTGIDLIPVLNTVKTLLWFCLAEDLLIRGGIGYGKYWEERDANNFYIVSEGLIKAVEIEKTVGLPVIAISDDIELGLEYWIPRFKNDTGVNPIFNMPLVHYDGNTFVNPLNPFWNYSAKIKTKALLKKFPDHCDKYNWLLDFYSVINKNSLLIPEEVFNKFLQLGIIKRKC